MQGDAMKVGLSFDGAFGPNEASRAAGQIEGAVDGALVILDFVRCAKVDPSALARLAGAIAHNGGRMMVLGLSRHDLRILHYLVGSLGFAHAPNVDAD